MKIALLTIGNELLEGRILDRNAAFFCQTLYSNGYLVHEKRSVLDRKPEIIQAFKDLLKTNDLVVTSGGLGPTLDDLTLSCACEFLNTPLEFNEPLFKKLQKQFPYLKHEFLKYAAFVPKKGIYFKNHVGVVPGYLFEKNAKQLILLPGVPHEFQHLVEKEVLTRLLKKHPPKNKEHKEILHLCRVPESEIAPLLEDFKHKNPLLDFGIYPHLGLLSIHVKVKAKEAKEAKKIASPVIKHLQRLYPKKHFSGKYSLQEALLKFFKDKKMTLSMAESCSGGALASYITETPGVSNFFKGSIVAYQNSIKQKLLKVSKTLLDQQGAVSQACVEQMAIGCNALFETDVAIATSGIAGPDGGSQDKPVGTVWIAIAKKKQILFCEKFLFKGQRFVIIERTKLYSLAQLWMIRDNL